MPHGKTTSLDVTAEQFRALVSASPIGQVMIDRQGNVLVSNPAATAIFAWQTHESVAAITDATFVLAFQTLCDQAWNGETVGGVELTLLRGGQRWVLSASLVAVRDDKSAEERLLAFFENITARKALEKQLAQVQKLDAIGKLAGGVAHDFNNLLTVITGRSHRILSRLKPEDPLWTEADIIHQTGERAAKLVRQLLAFSRKQVGPAQIVKINDVIADMDRALHSLTGEGIALSLQLNPDLMCVSVDPAQLEQAILNMVVNACEAMTNGGRLHISTDNYSVSETFVRTHVQARVGIYVRLAIRDTGDGMDETTQARAFEPFFTTRASAAGLGLATVYGMVTQANGFLTIDSSPGAGCTISVHIPAVNLDHEQVSGISAVSFRQRKTNETILVVEDEDDVRSLVRQVLEAQGYQVYVASNWIEAFGMAKKLQGSIDLLLTDVIMPQMSGREIAASLQPLCPHMRVLFMSGYADRAIVQHGVLKSGINFIQKPFNPDGLLQAIRGVLDR